MDLSELQVLVDSEWQLETQLNRIELPNRIREALTSETEFSQFEFKVIVPADQPTFAFVVDALNAIEKRIRLAMIFTFIEPGRPARFGEIDLLLHEFRAIPITVTALKLSSVEVEGKTDPEAVKIIIQIDDRKPPKSSWRKKLLNALLIFFAGSSMTFLAMNYASNKPMIKLPTTTEVAQTIDEYCGVLPDGTKITVKTGVVEVEMTCGGTDSDASDKQ
jgi:hypothetical protein